MKITKNDILTLQNGIPQTFIFDDIESCRSAKSYAYQLKDSKDLPEGISGYSAFIKRHDLNGFVYYSITLMAY